MAGNFLELGFSGFDVVVSVDSLASIADHGAFVKGVADSLKPSGYLILTTQNPFVMSRRSTLAPVAAGQVRNWADQAGLRALLTPLFHIKRLYTVLPTGDKGILRVTNSPRLNRILAAVMGERALARLKEASGLGQTIIAFAQKIDPDH